MIDAHTHIFHRDDALDALFRDRNLRVVVVNITGKDLLADTMSGRWRKMRRLREQDPDRFILCTTFDAARIGDEGFAGSVLDQLRLHIDQGARLVKVWKDIGLNVRDLDGSFVQIDDDRLRPIWDFLSARNVPVLAHIGEPRAAWHQLDPTGPHYKFYSTHPEHHLLGRPDIPSWDALMDARDRWLETNPGLTVIGAHLGSMAHDVAEVARRLESYQNFYVDTAERFGDLFQQESATVRAFFNRFADRILYGSDVIMASPDDVDADAYDALLASHVRYLESDGIVTVQGKLTLPAEIPGLGIQPPVLDAVLEENAARLLIHPDT